MPILGIVILLGGGARQMSVLVSAQIGSCGAPSTDSPNDGQGSIEETMGRPNATAIIEFPKIGMGFARYSAEPLPVLKDIDAAITDGEILGLLGRSGSNGSASPGRWSAIRYCFSWMNRSPRSMS